MENCNRQTANSKRRTAKQSQKRYMVSGSLYPLISFFDVSYLVSFVVPPHRRASGGLEPAGRSSEPAGMTLEPVGRALETAGRVSEQARSALEPAGRALEPAERAWEPARRALEPAGRALEPAGRPGASWEGQLRGWWGGTQKTEEEQSITSMWWYHRSLSPTGLLPKRRSTIHVYR